ncbi:Hypothetical predicted protein [Lecanosticta acicola]|uniref:Homologous-pairing protein 2 winged helix domain-containing protein n=1 Tax=Lecanosticta acicola TaxID=111012 RepID=A0AAI8YZF7_9PEZI|nr:Hypothetical predicted protein [Lecanosticta acicola]
MAPTKKDATKAKEAKLSPQEQATTILNYLRKTNRPYSATDISANLKNRVTKTAAQKLLKDMEERKDIAGAASGKQQVYHALQPELEEDQVEQLREIDTGIARLREETNALKSEEKELRETLRKSTTQIPLPQLKSEVAGLESQKHDIETRLTKLKGGNLKPISAEEKAKVNDFYRRAQKSLDARKKIRLELFKTVEESVGKEKGVEVKDELGLEF